MCKTCNGLGVIVRENNEKHLPPKTCPDCGGLKSKYSEKDS